MLLRCIYVIRSNDGFTLWKSFHESTSVPCWRLWCPRFYIDLLISRFYQAEGFPFSTHSYLASPILELRKAIQRTPQCNHNPTHTRNNHILDKLDKYPTNSKGNQRSILKWKGIIWADYFEYKGIRCFGSKMVPSICFINLASIFHRVPKNAN